MKISLPRTTTRNPYVTAMVGRRADRLRDRRERRSKDRRKSWRSEEHG